MEAESKLPKHHYIPVFYLREWTNDQGRLLEFSRPTGGEVKTRPTSPKGTGFVRGLYRISGPDDATSEAFERVFFQTVDNLAKEALDILLGRSHAPWTLKTRSAWSRFVVGMMFRNPERVAATRRFIEDLYLDKYEEDEARYRANNPPEAPPYLDIMISEIAYGAVDWTRSMMDSKKIGQFLNTMRWSVRDISSTGLTLFTSDRPYMMPMSTGLAGDNGHLAMPISPHKVFIACHNEAIEDHIKRLPNIEILRAMNQSVLQLAQKYAWAVDDKLFNKAEQFLSKKKEQAELFFDNPPNRAYIGTNLRLQKNEPPQPSPPESQSASQ